MPGKFITIEGIEGAGKSTAVKYIHTYLLKHQIEPVLTREPGGTPLAEAIRDLLLNPHTSEDIDPKAELLMMFASRAQHLSAVILPALAEGKWVVCDRFVDATYAYQHAGRGLEEKWISLLETFVVGNLKPDKTILLDIDPDAGMARSRQRGPQDRFEKEKLEFFEKVRHAYRERALQEKERFQIIDAKQSLAEVQAQLRGVLEALI